MRRNTNRLAGCLGRSQVLRLRLRGRLSRPGTCAGDHDKRSVGRARLVGWEGRPRLRSPHSMADHVSEAHMVILLITGLFATMATITKRSCAASHESAVTV